MLNMLIHCVFNQFVITIITVSLNKLENKQNPHTKLSMYPIDMHIGEAKTAFTILAAYRFGKLSLKF